MDFEEKDRIELGRFRKNGSEIVKVSTWEYKGLPYIDIRVFSLDYENDRDGNPGRPTTRGICLALGKFEDLRRVLDQAWAKLAITEPEGKE